MRLGFFQSLGNRLLLLVVAVLVAANVLQISLFQSRYVRARSERGTALLQGYASRASVLVAEFLSKGKPVRDLPDALQREFGNSVVVAYYDLGGRLVAGGGPEELRAQWMKGIQRLVSDNPGKSLRTELIDGKMLIGTRQVNLGVNTLGFVAAGVSRDSELLRGGFESPFVISLSVLAVSVIVGGLIAHGLTRSVRRLAEEAEYVAEGDLSQQVSVNTSDELRLVALAFNRLAGRVAEYQEQKLRAEQVKDQMVTSLFAELNTSLFFLEEYFETARRSVGARHADELNAWRHSDLFTPDALGLICDEVNLMKKELKRSFAEGQRGGREIKRSKEPFDLAASLEETIEQYQDLFNKKGVKVLVSNSLKQAEVMAYAKPLHFSIRNLLHYMLAHMTMGDVLAVNLLNTEEHAILELISSGEGPPSHRVAKVLHGREEVLGQVLREEDDELLCLYLAKWGVELNEGFLQVEQDLRYGTRFSTFLPL